MDLAIIAALKKYHYIKSILCYNNLHSHSWEALKEQGYKLRRGLKCAAFENPAYLSDAAKYEKKTWDDVSKSTIKNAFVKADWQIIIENECNYEDGDTDI